MQNSCLFAFDSDDEVTRSRHQGISVLMIEYPVRYPSTRCAIGRRSSPFSSSFCVKPYFSVAPVYSNGTNSATPSSLTSCYVSLGLAAAVSCSVTPSYSHKHVNCRTPSLPFRQCPCVPAVRAETRPMQFNMQSQRAKQRATIPNSVATGQVGRARGCNMQAKQGSSVYR